MTTEVGVPLHPTGGGVVNGVCIAANDAVFIHVHIVSFDLVGHYQNVIMLMPLVWREADNLNLVAIADAVPFLV